MKCPLRILVVRSNSALGPNFGNECLKEECAWWDSVSQTCVALSIYQELRLLVGAVAIVTDKIPPARE